MIARIINSWAEIVINHRKWVLLATAILIAFMSISFKNLYFDASNEMWFLQNDPSLKDYEFLKDQFGSPQALLVGISKRSGEDGVITAQNMKVIHEISEFLENHEFINKVSSLSKYQVLTSDDDTLKTVNLVEDFDQFEGTEADINRIRKIMAGETLVHDFMITKDLNDTLIFARSEYIKNSIDHKVKIIDDFNRFLEKRGYSEQGYKFYLMGDPVISHQFLSASMNDQMTTFPLMFLLITILLIFSFRSMAGGLMPWLVIVLSTISMIGVLGMMGWSLNMLNVMLPILVIVAGIGDSVHIVVEFYQEGNEGKDSKEAAKASIRAMFIPVAFTSITTFIGFTAVSITRLNPIREYGIIAGAGVTFALLYSLTTLPAVLSFVTSKGKRAKSLHETGWVAKITTQIAPLIANKWQRLIVIGAGLLVAAFTLASFIEVDSNFVRSFKKGTNIRNAMDYFDDIYNGGLTLEFVFDSGEANGINDPAFLKDVLKFQGFAESLETSGKVNSLVNFIRKINQTMHNEDPAYYVVPNSRELVAQYLLLYSLSSPDEDLSDLKSFDDRHARVSLRIENMTTAEMERLIATFKDRLSAEHPNLKPIITGDMVLWTTMGSYIESGLVQSFSLAIVAVMICFFLVFRSFRYGLLALIPSMTPIVMAGGLMVILGITMDFTTMIVASVTFGIAVDDTIHVMNRYLEARRSGFDSQAAIHKAVTSSGRAVVFTSLILISGFGMLTLSSFIPNVYFGLFGMTIILMALVSSLLFLPAVIFALEKDKVPRAQPVIAKLKKEYPN
ncbi:MAG: RND family transporter [Deltaproteobacteria bacterium]|nr:RND family transporter [Deltaproteobacteria bacterium]